MAPLRPRRPAAAAVGSLVALAGHHPRPLPLPTRLAAPLLVAELVDIVDGKAIYDEEFTSKQPDWTYDEVDSGSRPSTASPTPRKPARRRVGRIAVVVAAGGRRRVASMSSSRASLAVEAGDVG